MEMKFIGIVIILVGIILSLFNKFICRFLCGVCSDSQLFPCFSLLLFVGILLVVAGYATTTLKKVKLQEIKFKKNQ